MWRCLAKPLQNCEKYKHSHLVGGETKDAENLQDPSAVDIRFQRTCLFFFRAGNLLPIERSVEKVKESRAGRADGLFPIGPLKQNKNSTLNSVWCPSVAGPLLFSVAPGVTWASLIKGLLDAHQKKKQLVIRVLFFFLSFSKNIYIYSSENKEMWKKRHQWDDLC